MNTKEPTQSLPSGLHTSLRTAVSLVLAGSLAALTAATVTAGNGQSRSGSSISVNAVRLVSTTISTRHRTWTYDWPVKPFDRQHPVRAFLNDPRIGAHGGKAFHFGIDISAPDGTPVYAVEAGTVYFDSPAAIAVVSPDRSHSFGYWHIVPAVKSHQFVDRHQLLGYIGKGWEHVHFAERRGDAYVNPLRNGGIGPYADHTAPTLSSVSVTGPTLVAVASDTPFPVVPGGWAHEPVTPALIEVKFGGRRWRTAVDFRTAMLPRSAFTAIYTPATRQNHKGEPGCFSFYLVRDLTPQALAKSRGAVEIRVSDISGNSSVYLVRIGVSEV